MYHSFLIHSPADGMSLLFNMLSRLVITFLSRSKCLLISWLQSPSSVILELPHARGQGRRARGVTTPPRPGAAAKRSNLTSKERWLCGSRRAERSYSTFKVRRGGHEEIPLVQGKEQWLRFGGAAVNRYPTTKVRETQERQLVL